MSTDEKATVGPKTEIMDVTAADSQHAAASGVPSAKNAVSDNGSPEDRVETACPSGQKIVVSTYRDADELLRSFHRGRVRSSAVAAFLGAGEYITEQVILSMQDAANDPARGKTAKSALQRHFLSALVHDSELKRAFGHTIVTGGGSFGGINSVALKRREKKRAKRAGKRTNSNAPQ